MSTDTEYERRKRILEVIKQFARSEQEEVYRILRRNNEEISENRNGIFFDLNALKEKTVDDLWKWIEFCKQNKELFEKRNEEIEKMKQDYHIE